jgi:hypothetical protein
LKNLHKNYCKLPTNLKYQENLQKFTSVIPVLSDPNNSTQVNQTVPVYNQKTAKLWQLKRCKIIRGKCGVNRVTRYWWGQRIYLCNTTTHSIVNGMTTVAGLIGLLGVSKIIAGAILLCVGVLRQVNIHNTGVRVWIAWTGHVIRIDAQRRH